MLFPIFRLKTNITKEKIKQNNKYYLADTRIDVSIYTKSDSNFSSVIIKEILYNNGYNDMILLKYISNISSYEDALDMIDDFLNEYFNK